MHARENRNVDIDVIVHLHLRFRFGLAEDQAHVLDEAPLERRWAAVEEVVRRAAAIGRPVVDDVPAIGSGRCRQGASGFGGGGVRGSTSPYLAPRHDLDFGVEGSRESCHGPKLGVYLRGKQPPDDRVVTTDLPREICLRQSGTDAQVIESLHDGVHLRQLLTGALVLGLELRVLEALAGASPVVAGIEHDRGLRITYATDTVARMLRLVNP